MVISLTFLTFTKLAHVHSFFITSLQMEKLVCVLSNVFSLDMLLTLRRIVAITALHTAFLSLFTFVLLNLRIPFLGLYTLAL